MSEENEVSQEDIDKATRQGWTDQEAWEDAGKDPKLWVDAHTFLERGENTLPILRKKYQTLESEFERLKQSERDNKRTMEEFVKFQQGVEKRAYDKALKEIKAQKAEAVESGDKSAFNQAEEEEERIRQEYEESKKASKQETKDEVHPDWQDWINENPWYTENQAAGAMADGIGARLQHKTSLSGKAFWNEVKKQVQEAMPDVFENPNRKKAASVEGEGGSKPSKKGKTYSDLPADAKAACDDFVKRIPGYTKEQYLKDYDWSQA